MAKLKVEVHQYERQLGNWLKAYMEYTKEGESPDNYHIWVGLSTVASAVRRNVWLDQGIYILYPNMYVALVGPPARTAKSTAIRMGRRLVQNVPGVILGPDACSREQLIKKMAESKFDNQCSLLIHSSEFSSIIDTSGILMVQFLTDIYDCDYANPSGWKYETKTQGKDNIVNPCLNMVVGTTPSYLAESMPDNVIAHGFTSRTVFVYEEVERHQRPRPAKEDPVLARMLIEDLTHISSLQGEFKMDQSAEDAYDKFYRSLYVTIPSDNRVEGYHWRKKIHVLKVAMVLSLAERDDKIITGTDIDTAVAFMQSIEPNMARAFSAVGKYDHAGDLERLGAYVATRGGCTVQELFQKFYHLGDGDALRGIISTLHVMGAVKLVVSPQGEYLQVGPRPMPW